MSALRRHSDQRHTVHFDPVLPILGVVLVLAAFLRWWDIGSKFHFMGDEGLQTSMEWRLLHGHLPLLGPSLSIGAMHLGPVFYYLMAPALAVSGGSAVGPTVLVGLFGVAAVALLFLYLRVATGPYAALGACAVMAASFLMVEYSRRPWNPTLTPFFVLLFLWSLTSWKRSSAVWMVVAAGSLACLLQLQPVNIFVIPVAVIFVVAARPSRPSAAIVAAAILVFLLISSPLLIYDATHHLANTRAWLSVLVHGKSSAPARHASSLRLLFNLFNRAFELRIIPLSLGLAVLLVIAGVIAGLSRSTANDTAWEVLLAVLLLLVAALGFEVYHKVVFEQYLVCLFVAPFVFLGGLLSLLSRWRWGLPAGVVLVLALVVVGVRDTWTYSFVRPQVTVADAAVTRADLQPDDTYGHVVAVSRRIIRWTAGTPFSLRMASYLNAPDAYDYVLRRLGHAPRTGGRLVLIVEPSSWPRHDWPPTARRIAASSLRRTRMGIVRLYLAP